MRLLLTVLFGDCINPKQLIKSRGLASIEKLHKKIDVVSLACKLLTRSGGVEAKGIVKMYSLTTRLPEYCI